MKPIPKDFLKTFDKSMEYLKLDHVDLLSLHGDQQPRVAGFLAAQERLPGRGAQIAARRPRAFHRVFHARDDGRHLDAVDSDEFDYFNVHWYFVNDLNWPAIVAARKRDMGVFIISPNDKGGKLYEPPQKLVELVRAAVADDFQRPLLPRAAGSPHAELRRGAAGRFRRTHQSAEIL